MRVPRPLTVGAVVALCVARGRNRQKSRARAADRGQLRYHVPVGQDAAAVLASVRNHGFSAAVEIAGGDEDIAITCNRREAREQIRSILSNAPVDMNGHPFDGPPVTFVDE